MVSLPSRIREFLENRFGWDSPQPVYVLSDDSREIDSGFGWLYCTLAHGANAWLNTPSVAERNVVPLGYDFKPMVAHVFSAGVNTYNMIGIYPTDLDVIVHPICFADPAVTEMYALAGVDNYNPPFVVMADCWVKGGYHICVHQVADNNTDCTLWIYGKFKPNGKAKPNQEFIYGGL